MKFTFSGDQAACAAQLFGLAEKEDGEHLVYFFDSLDDDGKPTLLGDGVILRVRCKTKGVVRVP